MKCGERCSSKEDVQNYINQVINWLDEGTRESKMNAFDRLADLDNVWLSQFSYCCDYLSQDEYVHFKRTIQELIRQL